MNLFDWYLYLLPWWLHVLLVALVTVVAMVIAANVFGWARIRGWALPIAGLIVVFGTYARSRQQGYNDRKADEDKALKKAEQVADDERNRARKLPDDKLDQEIDRWSRP